MNAIVHLSLANFTTSNDGNIHLSPQLMSEGEIDAYVKALKDDLDHVGSLAKKALRKSTIRIHNK